MYRNLTRKAPFAVTSFKRGGWAYFRGWANFWEIMVVSTKLGKFHMSVSGKVLHTPLLEMHKHTH